jgi:hypothetical protein
LAVAPTFGSKARSVCRRVGPALSSSSFRPDGSKALKLRPIDADPTPFIFDRFRATERQTTVS